MKDNYLEILDLVKKEPIWYNLHGVPRFSEPTVPQHLMGKIKCQACGKIFWVNLATPVYIGSNNSNIIPLGSNKWKLRDNWHYGDPPFHGCVGDSMNSIPEWEWEQFDKIVEEL